MRFAEVAVDAPTMWGRTFSYSVPRSLILSPGHLVNVPLGRRQVYGVVFRGTTTPSVDQTRNITGLVESQPLLLPSQLELAQWISVYYRAPLFAAAALMLPPGFRTRARSSLALLNEWYGDSSATIQANPVLDILKCRRGRVPESLLERLLGSRALKDADLLVRSGVAERIWDRPRVGPRYVSHLRLTSEWHGLNRYETDKMVRRAPRQAELLEVLISAAAHGRWNSLAETRSKFGSSAVAGLIAKGLAEVVQVRYQRDPLDGYQVARSTPPLPTDAQSEALLHVMKALDDSDIRPRSFLLHGVTGSGKTEVYLQALAHCLENGKKGLVLVPEIALTPQTVQHFSARFPGKVAVLHSGLSLGQQFDQWWQIHDGGKDIVVGSRSAVFAPISSIGLIVLDEEHEWTYKQHDPAPRYHSRDVALKLSEITGAVVILGSATPDVSTYYRALRRKHRLLTLPERIADADSTGRMASVQIVDMRRELRDGNRSIFSRTLQSALGQCLNDGGRAILFLNRRGEASVVQCRDCGYVIRCSRCAVALTFHGFAYGSLVCHTCNRRRRLPQKCTKCSGHRIRYLGLGTQRVVDEVEKLFPAARVMRWDRDVAATWRAHETLLERFSSGEADILVGTQMVAKGLHIPTVTLVGAILADIGLNIPDFRAAEKGFQVLCQVAGRAGRGASDGSVVIQTYAPDHYAVIAAADQNYPGFYKQELSYRREQDNPPFSRLIRLEYASSNQLGAQRQAQRLGSDLHHQREVWGLTDIDIIGPAPAYPEKIRGRFRWHLILRGREPHSLLDRVSLSAGWQVDVDSFSVA